VILSGIFDQQTPLIHWAFELLALQSTPFLTLFGISSVNRERQLFSAFCKMKLL